MKSATNQVYNKINPYSALSRSPKWFFGISRYYIWFLLELTLPRLWHIFIIVVRGVPEITIVAGRNGNFQGACRAKLVDNPNKTIILPDDFPPRHGIAPEIRARMAENYIEHNSRLSDFLEEI